MAGGANTSNIVARPTILRSPRNGDYIMEFVFRVPRVGLG